MKINLLTTDAKFHITGIVSSLMNVKIASVILILLITESCNTQDKPKVVLPGEWEPQEAIWLGWEHRPEKVGYHTAIFEIIKSIKDDVKINIVSPTDSIGQVAKNLVEAQNINLDNINFLTVKGNRYWIRDHGPTFVRNQHNELLGVDFDWEVRQNHDPDIPFVDRIIVEREGFEVITAAVVNEGGAIESNGAGTILLVESVTLDRNPQLSKSEIEKIYKASVGAEKVIWLKRGLANDPKGQTHIVDQYYGYGTGGHVDEFARFVEPKTILLAWVSEEDKSRHPINQLNYDILTETFEILSSQTDQDGSPFNIIKIPLPDIISETRSSKDTLLQRAFKNQPTERDSVEYVAAASYNNFLVTNGKVLLPTYTRYGSSEEKENSIREIFSNVFPNRELVFIDCMYQNYHGGGIHCSTKQQPL